MATNELAAILAQRRAKAGGESESAIPVIKQNAPPALETPPSAAKSSIAERIARLKQQSAVASTAGEAAPAPPYNHRIMTSDSSNLLQGNSSSVSRSSSNGASVTSTASESVDTSAVAAAQDAAGIRRASNKIQQLQGSLGINVNPFGRPGGPSSGRNRQSVNYERESIMKTGEEQYGHTQHAMGVAMPGMMGSAIPMPGLAKGGFCLPGMAPKGEQRTETPSTALDDSHATMNRVAGPKRRGPTRPPPGAFRIPTMAAPIIDTVEPFQALVAEPAAVTAAVASADILESKAQEAPAVVSAPMPAAANLFSTPATGPALDSAPEHAHVPTPSPVPVPTAAATMHKLPEREIMPPMKPYELHDDPFTPAYGNQAKQNTSAPAGFPSALMANFSMDELVLDDQPKPKQAAVSSTSATSLFGVDSTTTVPISEPYSPPSTAPVENPIQVETPMPVVPERVPSPIRVRAPAPVASTPSPVLAPTPAPVSASTPASSAAVSAFAPATVGVSTPTPPAPAPAFVPAVTPAATTPSPAPISGSYLFGAAASAASDGDDSSESDWSDDDGKSSQSLFGGGSKPVAVAPAPTLLTSSQPTSDHHQSPTPASGSLFGSCAPVPATPAPGFVQAAPETSIPPAAYSSLFGGAGSSSSESDSDSDDGGGLFGTGVPSNR